MTSLVLWTSCQISRMSKSPRTMLWQRPWDVNRELTRPWQETITILSSIPCKYELLAILLSDRDGKLSQLNSSSNVEGCVKDATSGTAAQQLYCDFYLVKPVVSVCWSRPTLACGSWLLHFQEPFELVVKPTVGTLYDSEWQTLQRMPCPTQESQLLTTYKHSAGGCPLSSSMISKGFVGARVVN